MDFVQFDEQVEQISNLIITDRFEPDAIVAIARGGWIPARLFSKYLKVKKLLSYGMTYTDATRTTTFIYQAPNLSPDMQKILVVEDFLESGKSIKQAIDALKMSSIDVRSASLGYLETTILVPDYSLGVLAQVPKFPWD